MWDVGRVMDDGVGMMWVMELPISCQGEASSSSVNRVVDAVLRLQQMLLGLQVGWVVLAWWDVCVCGVGGGCLAVVGGRGW